MLAVKSASQSGKAFVTAHALMQQHIAVLGIMRGRLQELLLHPTRSCHTIKTNYTED